MIVVIKFSKIIMFGLEGRIGVSCGKLKMLWEDNDYMFKNRAYHVEIRVKHKTPHPNNKATARNLWLELSLPPHTIQNHQHHCPIVCYTFEPSPPIILTCHL